MLSRFDNQRRTLPDIVPLLKQLNTRANLLNEKRMNKGRRGYQFRINETVYLLNKRRSKLDELWTGPYIIQGITKDGNRVTLGNNMFQTTVNVKHIRPASLREGSMSEF